MTWIGPNSRTTRYAVQVSTDIVSTDIDSGYVTMRTDDEPDDYVTATYEEWDDFVHAVKRGDFDDLTHYSSSYV